MSGGSGTRSCRLPRETLRYWTGSWRVPLEIQNQLRGWLGLPPLSETAQDLALHRIEQRLAQLRAATFADPPSECALCHALGPRQGGSPMEGDGEPFVPETDTESLTRVSFDEVRRAAVTAEFGTDVLLP